MDAWNPRYLRPHKGRTEQEMVFTTGSGEDFTIWNLVDFDTSRYYSRYSRVTPALRAGTVEVRCEYVGEETTDVEVSYKMTALTDKGVDSLKSFEGAAFADMINGWKRSVDQHLDVLLTSDIR